LLGALVAPESDLEEPEPELEEPDEPEEPEPDEPEEPEPELEEPEELAESLAPPSLDFSDLFDSLYSFVSRERFLVP
jgi:hypothetical protein